MNQKSFNIFSWGIVFTSLILVIIAWAIGIDWSQNSISMFKLFPLFGLVAWVLMAGHYYTGTLRVKNPELKQPKLYRPFTGYIVLISLLLHPGLLAFKQFSNTQLLPPESFISYVGENLKLAVMLGSFSLIIFLSFEFFDRAKNNKNIQKYWPAISISQCLAMILIWVHGVRLGGTLTEDWFRALWVLMGVALLPCFYIILKNDFAQNANYRYTSSHGKTNTSPSSGTAGSR